MKIILVEDDLNIQNHIDIYLSKSKYNIVKFSEAEKAIDYLDNNNDISLIITDLNLPGMSGEMFTQYIKKEKNIPVIMLTAKSNVDQIVEGLNIGADDYITKPFAMSELIARIEAITRRYYKDNEKILFQDNSLLVKSDNNEIEVDKNKVILTQNEYKILELLIENKFKILSRDSILQKISSGENEVFDRVIDAHIKSIRKKINDDVKEPKYIQTVYGGGYKFIGGSHD